MDEIVQQNQQRLQRNVLSTIKQTLNDSLAGMDMLLMFIIEYVDVDVVCWLSFVCICLLFVVCHAAAVVSAVGR